LCLLELIGLVVYTNLGDRIAWVDFCVNSLIPPPLSGGESSRFSDERELCVFESR